MSCGARTRAVGVRASPRRARIAGAALMALLLGAPPWAVAADCAITAVNLDFGSYDPLATSPDDAVGTVVVTCRYLNAATRVNYTVTLSSGSHSASYASRQMAGGTRSAARLGYNVYTDAARSRIWGNGAAGTVIASGAMTVGPGQGNSSRSVTHTVYGRVPALQDAVPGTYVDSLVLTLTF
jgi:spore coat protein U-like protein